MGYNLRPKNKPLLMETRTPEEIIARLKELEPWVEKVKKEMREQLRLSPDIWHFRFTI